MKKLLFPVALAALTGCGLLKTSPEYRVNLPPMPTSDSVFVRFDTLRLTDTVLTTGETLVYLDTTICPPADSATIVVKTVEKTLPGKVITRTVVVQRDSVIYRCDSMTIVQAVENWRSVNQSLTPIGSKDGMNWNFLIKAVALALAAALAVVGLLIKKGKQNVSNHP